MTVLELIKSSLRLIGQLGPGRSPGTSETADALFVLNSMLEAWNVERQNIYRVSRDTYTLTASLQPHTIGSAGTFNVARPIRVENAGVISVGGETEYPLEMWSAQRWAGETSKTLTSDIPAALYYEPAFPLGKLYLWPIPTTAATLALYTWAQLTGFANAAETVSFPPGYADAIRYNLAVKLAPEWGRVPRPDVSQMAIDSLAKIKSLNTPSLEMSCDPAFSLEYGYFDILQGRYF